MIEPPLSFEPESLSPQQAQELAVMLAGKGIQVAEKIIRNKLGEASILAGDLMFNKKQGFEVQADVEARLDQAMKYFHFLEVLHELKNSKPAIIKVKIA